MIAAPMTLGWRDCPDEAWVARVAATLEPWRGTRYRIGQRRPGVGVDCVRFVVDVLEQLRGGESKGPLPRVPHDVGFHDATIAWRSMREFLRRWRPAVDVTDSLEVQVGDVLVVGPVGGGPGHAMIVGSGRRVWHSRFGAGVVQTGLTLQLPLYRIYRPAEVA